jgi:hypothetical protein
VNDRDRRPLLLFSILLILPGIVAIIVALLTPHHLTSGGGAVILAPREGDEVGPSFSVDGTHGTSGVDVDIIVAGVFNGSGTCTSNPDWTVPFNAGAATGSHSASATGSPALDGVNFTIVGAPALHVSPATVSISLGGSLVTMTGQHSHPMAPPVVTVKLIRKDGTTFQTVTASDTGGGNWQAAFAGVPAGSYAAQSSMTVAGKTTTASRFVKVP